MRLKLTALLLGVLFLLLSGFRPGALPYTPGQVFSDAVTSHLPAAQFLRTSMLENGTFPLWRETIMAGQPFAADPLNKTAYPLQWLVLILPPALHLDVMIILHLLIAGAGMWVWARSFGLPETAAAFSALAYALAPRVIGHTGAGHLDLLYALAWFPWWLWAVGQLVHSDGSVGARHASPLYVSLSAGLFGALILLADVRLSFFAYLLAGAYALVECLRVKQARRLVWFVPAGIVILVLTLSFTVPLLAWRPYLSRGALTAEESGVFSLTPAQFLGLVLPPQTGNIETLTYLGFPVLVLALIGARRRPFWVAAALVAVLYALGLNSPFWRTLVQVIPALLWFRVPSRAWFVIVLIAPLLAGFGLQRLAEWHPRRGLLFAMIGLVIALIAGVFLTISVPTINGLALIVGGAGVSLILMLAFSHRLRGERLAWALIAVTFLDLALAGRGWLEWRTQEAWLPPDQVQLAQRLTEMSAERIYSPTYSLQQQVAEEYHLRIFGGVDPFQLNGIVAAVEQGGGIHSTGYSVTLPPLNGTDLATVNREAVPDTAVLGRWGVTHVVSAYPLNIPLLEPVGESGRVYVYANRDPSLKRISREIPSWPQGETGLPNAATVAQLNGWTLDAALVSGAAFIALLVLVGVMKVRT
ncbi:MAG: hypothetical protein GC204_02320 [Chloroflexi bacterium]|nr:hypothetical protein [Chloroflexota bacterium]